MATLTKKAMLEAMEGQMKDDIRWSVSAFKQGEMIEAVSDYRTASLLATFIANDDLFVSYAKEVTAFYGIEYSVWYKGVSRAYMDSLDETIRKKNTEKEADK